MRPIVLGVLVVAAVGAGCAPSMPRDRITFAVLAGVYYSAAPGVQVDAAMVEEAPSLLKKAVAELNAAKDLDFVVVSGDLLARAEAVSLDQAAALLAGLRVPYYVVLGEHDSPAPPAGGVSRSTVIWAFQGHGFSGARGYWSQEVLPGLMLVGLDTVQPGVRGGHIDPRQLAWLDQTLASSAGKSVIAVGHHGVVPLHPLDEGAAWQSMMVDNAAAVREVLERHPNVLMSIAGHHHLAEGRVSGRMVYLASPSVSVWPLAYHLIRLTPKEAEAVWVPLAGEELARRAQDRLLGSPEYRGVFPPGEDGDTACIRLFGGKKMEVYPLPAIRP